MHLQTAPEQMAKSPGFEGLSWWDGFLVGWVRILGVFDRLWLDGYSNGEGGIDCLRMRFVWVLSCAFVTS